MNKQIEEMAEDIVVYQCNGYIDTYTTAKILYEKGYRKIQTTDKEFFEQNCEEYGNREQEEFEWLPYGKDSSGEIALWRCRNCWRTSLERRGYCLACGAKMKGGSE